MNIYKLYRGDCLDVMSTFKDNEFDLCLTDPPYGILKNARLGSGNTSRKALGKPSNYGKIMWDDITFSLEQFKEVERISKNQIIFGGNYFNFLPISRGWMVWDKRRQTVQNDYGDAELIWTSYDVVTRICYHLWNGFLRDSEKGIQRTHPTQKPIKVMEWLLDKTDAKTVIDPFIGSGTTMVACQNRRLDCVGVEINNNYCQVVKDRCFHRRFLDREVSYEFIS